jgi:8-amino-7-oxononanoate synthase
MDPADLFERCRRYHGGAEYARRLGHPANPYFIPIDRSGGTEVVIDGRRLVMVGSNNYLGMTTHPAVQQAAADAMRGLGTACTGSRLLGGTLELHLELERRLARFLGKEAALVFATGYQTNLGVVSALLDKGDLVVADRDVHASVIDAIHLTRGQKPIDVRFFRHNDPGHLERLLADHPPQRARLVVVDGVYSTTGHLARLPELARVCRAHGARLMVDDAHGLGVTGGGRGTAVHLGCADQVDLITGTFSKSFASGGGFVAGRSDVIHWIQHYARPFVFSASLPPANAATVLAVLEELEVDAGPVERVNALAARMRAGLTERGFDVGEAGAAIVPVRVGERFRTVQAWQRLFHAGVYTNAVLPPAVRANASSLRTSYMATHSDQQLEEVLAAFEELAPEMERYRRRRSRPARVH